QVLPGAADARHPGLAAELALDADLAADPRDLVREGRQLVDHDVDRRLQLQDLAAGVDVDLLAEVAAGLGGAQRSEVAHLAGEVAGHRVDVVGEVLPRAGHPAHVRLAAELALRTDLAGDAGDLVGEGGELVDHRVDRRLQLEDLAAGVDVDLLAEVAA